MLIYMTIYIIYAYTCIYIYVYVYIHECMYSGGNRLARDSDARMEWLPLVGSLKLLVSFAKEPYKRYHFLQNRKIFLRGQLIVATSYSTFYYSSDETFDLVTTSQKSRH